MPPLTAFEARVLDHIRRHDLLHPEEGVLAAVSGGPDSVALLSALLALRDETGTERLIIFHFDHGLRGAESSEDKAFVMNLGSTFQVPVVVKTADVGAYRKARGVSMEMAARDCRLAALDEAKRSCGLDKVALGHNANDQAEEVLLRLFRGTGPAGLSGMRPATAGGCIRPLLFAPRRDILAYLKEKGLTYREDSTNQIPGHCLRNRIRLEILPRLEAVFHPRITETLCRHAELATAEESFWSEEVSRLWEEVKCKGSTGETALSVARLRCHGPAVRRRLIRHAVGLQRGHLGGLYAHHVESVMKLIERQHSGRSVDLPGGLKARLEGDRLEFAAAEPQQAVPFDFKIPETGSFEFPSLQARLVLKAEPNPPSGTAHGSPLEVCMDADRIRWPLTVRSWRPGDRFRPLGLGGSKKLQDFFVDARIPRSLRPRIPILCDAEKICWIVGRRLDERVAVSRGTSKVIRAAWISRDWNSRGSERLPSG
ncbi:tRNA lysidine(34) synthetase TilS [Desulfoglaeba alkanexedens]|uniref:tRNA(Ile)-lysidine synthase n=1 Tax=Desulfoglaeba alkanexedens ALDC TaxID=980445 RepID=A0A4P8L3L5_9BACT|nr:tRNA lysidine(34) synthetase TilS [Desulfoglaeba alkanexedens]QCQ22469.1 tRNA lysidine(34) synthetase TilS [Desulfoglaeba alkanexedens ALDC]